MENSSRKSRGVSGNTLALLVRCSKGNLSQAKDGQRVAHAFQECPFPESLVHMKAEDLYNLSTWADRWQAAYAATFDDGEAPPLTMGLQGALDLDRGTRQRGVAVGTSRGGITKAHEEMAQALFHKPYTEILAACNAATEALQNEDEDFEEPHFVWFRDNGDQKRVLANAAKNLIDGRVEKQKAEEKAKKA